jgi:hypothetical protein
MTRKNLTSLLLLALTLAVFLQYQIHPASAYTFQTPQLLDNAPAFDLSPTALQASDGTLWAAWDSGFYGQNQIVAMTYNRGVWSAQRNITWGPASQANTDPALAQLTNGTIILVWSANQTGYYNLYYKLLNAGVWSRTYPLTVSCTTGCVLGDGDVSPSLAVGLDSSVWVVWGRQTSSTAASCAVPFTIVCRQLFYKTLKGNVWSSDTQLTTDVTWNRWPGLTVVKDGTVWLVYSKWISKGSNYNIFGRTFNGAQWSGDVQLTNINALDFTPDIVQDRNGTIWLLWDRDISLGGGFFNNKVFYATSIDGGITWSSATQLTFGGTSTTPIDDRQPIPVQGLTRNLDGTVDHSLWVFYSSDAFLNGTDFAIYYVKSNSIFPVHNAAVTGVGVSPSIMFPWGIRKQNVSSATLTVTISNLGDFPENISYMVQAVNATTFNLASGFWLAPSGLSKTLTISWNASLASPGLYTLVASVSPIAGETTGNRMDDSIRFRYLGIVYPGDLNLSGHVTIIDASMFGAAWNSVPGMPNWNPDADLNHNGKIDIFDASIFGANWQKSICGSCP